MRGARCSVPSPPILPLYFAGPVQSKIRLNYAYTVKDISQRKRPMLCIRPAVCICNEILCIQPSVMHKASRMHRHTNAMHTVGEAGRPCAHGRPQCTRHNGRPLCTRHTARPLCTRPPVRTTGCTRPAVVQTAVRMPRHTDAMHTAGCYAHSFIENYILSIILHCIVTIFYSYASNKQSASVAQAEFQNGRS